MRSELEDKSDEVSHLEQVIASGKLRLEELQEKEVTSTCLNLNHYTYKHIFGQDPNVLSVTHIIKILRNCVFDYYNRVSKYG